MKKIRLLILSVEFYPDRLRGGGVYAKNLVSLIKNYFDVNVLTLRFRRDISLKQVIQVRVPWRIIDVITFYAAYFFYLIKAIMYVLKFKPHLIHACTIYDAVVPILLRKKYVAIIHDISPFIIGRITKPIAYLVLKTAKLLIFHTRAVLKAVSILTKRPDLMNSPRVTIIPETINISNYSCGGLHHVRRVLHKHPELTNKKIVLFVGALTREKGVPQLIEAMRIVRKKISNAILLLIGRLADQRISSTISKTVNKNFIIYVGEVHPAELPDYYHIANVCVFPSTGFEGQGVVLLEAMASGKPIIAGKLAAYIETAGNAAMYINGRSPKEIASAIVRVITNEELRKHMEEISRKRIKLYDPTRIRRLLLKVYCDVISNIHYSN